MSALRPLPLSVLVTRMLHGLEHERTVFHLPEKRWFLRSGACDLGVRFHGQRAATVLGPAAGPHTQMAQNMVLSWLGGGRIQELKTVQLRDDLVIPRPCIDMQTVGFNVEWSQELRLEESLEEYVKGAMLIRMLEQRLGALLAPGMGDTIFDMSVGYNLAGVQSQRVLDFIAGLRDATRIVDRLRREVPASWQELRDLPYANAVSGTLTLSTFHGCPPQEIEAIGAFVLERLGLPLVIKLNPMLLGAETLRGLLHDALGYGELRVPDSAFEGDPTWNQAVGFVGRLEERAAALGLGFGIKLTNTLIVENHRDFFPPGEREMYLSGPPLHVLAMQLVGRFREAFGADLPISFSAGIDRHNFAAAAALGLVPVTVCTDLLKPGGYGRARAYLDDLMRRMEACGARTLDDYGIRALGQGEAALASLGLDESDPRLTTSREALRSGDDLQLAAGAALHARWVAAARLLNTRQHAEDVLHEPRYRRDRNARPPRKLGSQLELFDCLTCDKCVPVCPNDAVFTLALEPRSLTRRELLRRGAEWVEREVGTLDLRRQHQIAVLADLCNACGNCDVFCPEDGGPHLQKPLFFARLEDWSARSDQDGFHVEPARIHARIAGLEYRLERSTAGSVYHGSGFEVRTHSDGKRSIRAEEDCDRIELVWAEVLAALHEAVTGGTGAGYLDALLSDERR